MLPAEEKAILEDYKKAFAAYYANKKQQVINLDEKFRKSLSYIIARLEDTLPDLNYTIPPVRQSRLVIHYLTNGEAGLIIGKMKVEANRGTLLIIPGQTINSGMYSPDVMGYHISFNLNFFLQKQLPHHHLPKMKIYTHRFVPYIHTNSKEAKILVNIFETLLDEHSHHKIHKEELMALKILELILVCERLLQTESPFQKNVLPAAVIQYIENIQKHYKDQHSTTYYAKKLNLHPNSLNALSKQYLGDSAKKIILTKLLSEAQYLLHHTSLSAKEISYELGFQSPSQFFRFFKNQTGRSPLDYRQQHLNLQ